MTAIVRRLTPEQHSELIEGKQSGIEERTFFPGSGKNKYDYEIVNVAPEKYVAVLSFFNNDGQEIFFAYDLDNRDEQIDSVEVFEAAKTQVDFLDVPFDTTDLRTISITVIDQGSERISQNNELKGKFFGTGNLNWILESGDEVNGKITLIKPGYGHADTTKKGDIIISDIFLNYLGITAEEIPVFFSVALDANTVAKEFTVKEEGGKKVIELTGEESFDNRAERDKNYPRLTKFTPKALTPNEDDSVLKFFVPESTNFKLMYVHGKDELYDVMSQAEIKLKTPRGAGTEVKKYDDVALNLTGKDYYLVLHIIGQAEETDFVYGAALADSSSPVVFRKKDDVKYPELNIALQRENSERVFKTALYANEGDFSKNIIDGDDVIRNIDDTSDFEFNFKYVQEGEYFLFFNPEQYFSNLRQKVIQNEGKTFSYKDYLEVAYLRRGQTFLESTAPWYAKNVGSFPPTPSLMSGNVVTSLSEGSNAPESNFLSSPEDRLFLLLSDKTKVSKLEPGGIETGIKYRYVEFLKLGLLFELNYGDIKNKILADILVKECDVFIVDKNYENGDSNFIEHAIPYVPLYEIAHLAKFGLKPLDFPDPNTPNLSYVFFSGGNYGYVTTEFFLLPQGKFIDEDAEYKVVIYPKKYKTDYSLKSDNILGETNLTRKDVENFLGVNFEKNLNVIGKIKIKAGNKSQRVSKSEKLSKNEFRITI